MRKSTRAAMLQEFQRSAYHHEDKAAQKAAAGVIEDLGLALAEILPTRPVVTSFAPFTSTQSARYPSAAARAFVSALVDAVKYAAERETAE